MEKHWGRNVAAPQFRRGRAETLPRRLRRKLTGRSSAESVYYRSCRRRKQGVSSASRMALMVTNADERTRELFPGANGLTPAQQADTGGQMCR